MKRGLVVALIVVVLLMGLAVVMPTPMSAHDASGAVHGCTACLAVLVVVGWGLVVAVRYLSARGNVFAPLCHPSPLERPPRLAA